MSLPVINLPKKTFKNKFLPNGKITLKPFTIGQESDLLMVKDSQDFLEKIDAIKFLIEDCVVDKLNIKDLPIFLIEYIFLLLRSISIGEIINISFLCKNKIEEKECNNQLDLKINIKDITIKDDGCINIIKLDSENIGIKLNYPTIDTLEKIKNFIEKSNNIETDTIISCIDSIFQDENVWTTDDFTFEEAKEFYNSLPLLMKLDISKYFFNKIPHLYFKTNYKCDKCGFEHNLEFNSLQEIFT